MGELLLQGKLVFPFWVLCTFVYTHIHLYHLYNFLFFLYFRIRVSVCPPKGLSQVYDRIIIGGIMFVQDGLTSARPVTDNYSHIECVYILIMCVQFYIHGFLACTDSIYFHSPHLHPSILLGHAYVYLLLGLWCGALNTFAYIRDFIQNRADIYRASI